ncbi:recombinase family protein [Clostridium algidicarnis]|uniref:recombinase family protein n=1 Tax=Clostridium algidicarnis TaxID=37659 RepID=UPI001C0BF3AD|nr:recombinase family protein [Clostridium algidicarnis]MBU3195025.1 recombinase family protein [Clostridium algidicarnis]
MLDSLEELGIEVRFEKEGINSLSEDGELMLTLLASFAQEESRSTSENVKWAIRKGFEQGKTNSFCIYGYRWDGEQFNIVPEEAEVVRLIYDNYLKDLSAEQTEKQLDEMGIKSYTGGRFSNTSIRAILRQERYTGNILLQKTYVENHISHKTKINKGELPMYYAENTHPAIIDQDTFDKVQAEVARRRELGVFANWSINTTCFTSKIKCGNCGVSYRRSGKRQSKSSNVYYIWTCQTKDRKGVSECISKNVPEKVLQKVCAEVLGLEEFDEDVFLGEVERIVVIGKDELIFHFYDGQIVNQKWKSTARNDCWSEERRREWGERHKGIAARAYTQNCFTGKIRCPKCGANFRRAGRTYANGEKVYYWSCGSGGLVCDAVTVPEEIIKTLSSGVLGITEFDESLFPEKIEYLNIVSDSEIIFHLIDGSEVPKPWEKTRRTTKFTEERKRKQSEKMKEVWRKKHEQQNS